MQDLGLSDYTPRTEGRLKTLFWPTIENELDVDTVTRQGFWLCMVIAGITAVTMFLSGPAVLLDAVFFFFAGVGTRRRSIAAAAGALLVYSFTTVVLVQQGVAAFGITRILLTALLLANLRATVLSARLRASATEPPPLPLEGTWQERFSDRMPIPIWPWGQWIFYALAALMLVGMGATVAGVV